MFRIFLVLKSNGMVPFFKLIYRTTLVIPHHCLSMTQICPEYLHLWATEPSKAGRFRTKNVRKDCKIFITSLNRFNSLCVLPLATAPFQRLLHRSGTVCWSRSGHLRRCKFSAADWKLN